MACTNGVKVILKYYFFYIFLENFPKTDVLFPSPLVFP